jgi:PAS domain S-box-containing protein
MLLAETVGPADAHQNPPRQCAEARLRGPARWCVRQGIPIRKPGTVPGVVDRPTLVIVDDDADVRTLVRTRLGLDGRFEVVGEGADGHDAIRLAGEHLPDLMLLDVRMPGLDGLSAIGAIQAASPGTRVVIYSGMTEPDVAARALAHGATAFIDKLEPLDRLADQLAAVLSPADRIPVAAGVVEPADGPVPAQAAATAGVEAPPPGRSTEQALWQSEERFRLLVETVSDYAIFLLDPAGYIVSWNLGAERINGYRSNEALGRHFRMFYPAEAQAAGHPEEELAIAVREGRYEEEGWRIRKDGSRFWSTVVITAVRDPAGQLVGFAKVTRDITERRQMLAERERAAAAVSQANARLAEANVRLAGAAEERAQLLAVTAHELRTPVRVLTGAADTLAGHWSELTPTEKSDLLDSMRSSGGRIRGLLDDLLTAARLEAGGIEVRAQPTAIRPLLLDAVGQASATYPATEIAVNCPDGLTAQADGNRLGQILLNYLTNALRHGAPPVRVDVDVDDREVRIAVRDDGPGVPADLVPRLFSKFAPGSHGGGTGLGLFIVRQLARAQGGDAWYDRRGDTSTFGVWLPSAGQRP